MNEFRPKYLILIVLLALCSPTLLLGANTSKRTVTGSVVDANGNPLAGVIVQVLEEAGNGMATPLGGTYSLEVAADKTVTLRFSYTGMESQEFKMAPNTNVAHIKLQPLQREIADVVVTGYSQTNTKQLTGSVGVLTADDLKNKPQTSMDALLQGAIPGVNVTSMTGRPGAQQRIRIRGVGNFSGNTQPLWVVDGVPLDSRSPDLSSSERSAIGFDDIFLSGVGGVNPADIESITVLKNAAAAAIYGSRAANGVIVVTTKKGAEGDMKVSFSNKVSVTMSPARSAKLMNSREKLAWENELWDEFSEGYFNSGDLFPAVGIVGQIRSGQFGFGNLLGDREAQDAMIDEFGKTNTNWHDVVSRNAVSFDSHLALSGGGSRSNYRIAMGYTNDKGMLKGNDADRYSFKANYNIDVNKKLRLGFITDVIYQKSKMPIPTVNPFTYAYFANPYEKPYNADGSYATDHTYLTLGRANRVTESQTPLPYNGFNILREMAGNTSTSRNNEARIQGSLRYKIIEGLSFDGLISYRFKNNRTDKIRMADTWGAFGERLGNDKYNPENIYGSITQNKTDERDYMVRGHFSFNRDFGADHSLNMIAGAELRGNKSNLVYLKRYNYDSATGSTILPPISGDENSWLAAVNKLSGENYSERRYASFYLSGDYIFKNRYVLNGTIRADGSSNFGSDSQFNPNWSVGGAWLMHEEPFMQSIKDVVSTAKISASYGFTGNVYDNAVNTLIMRYQLTNFRLFDGLPYKLGYTDSYPPSPGLGWEKVNDFQLAVDLGFFNDRLTLKTEIYQRMTKEAVDAFPLYRVSGYSNQYQNVQEVRNRGIEITLSGDIVKSADWNVRASVNLGLNSNKIMKYQNLVGWSHFNLLYYEGYPARAIIGGKLQGIDPSTGLYYFKLRPDAVIESNTDYNRASNYLYYLGTREAPVQGGFNLSAAFKGLSLSVSGVYSFGATVYDRNESPAGYRVMTNTSSGMEEVQTEYNDLYSNHLNVTKDRTDRWTEENNMGTKYPRIYDRFHIIGHFKDNNPMDNSIVNSVYLQDVNYVKIRNIILSYTLPYNFVRRIGLDDVSVHLSLNDFFTFTNYKGIDPEMPGATYTTPRSITFGVSLQF